jgi:AAA family ATP:ADP antiporter
VLASLVCVQKHEVSALLWSCSYFFSLLCSYYIIRPMRDEMGIAGGVENLQWLFSGTFLLMLSIVPLFGWVSSRFPRRRFLPSVYYFFIFNLLLFFVLFRSDVTHAWVARAFFMWVSVFNLFVVSVFWSFMTDLFSNEQAKRLFGFISAGGTAGALIGPVLTTALAIPLGPTNLLLVSMGFLLWAVICVKRLIRSCEDLQGAKVSGRPASCESEQAIGGSVVAGIGLVARSPYLLGVCALMLLFTTLATFLYFQQAQIIRDHFADPAERTTVFAAMDLAVNILTVLIQIFLTGRLISWLGLPLTLSLIPLLLAAGFALLGYAPVLSALIVVQVIRRAGNYAIMRPAREMLYVVLGREEKYKAKNFIDTVVYRAGDAASAWVYAGLRAMGLNLAAIAWLAVPVAMSWAWLAFRLGKRQGLIAGARAEPAVQAKGD